MSFEKTCHLELEPKVEILLNGRRRVTRRFRLGKNNNIDDVIFAAYGDADPGEVTSCTTGYANLKLVAQQLEPTREGQASVLVQVFETLTSTLVDEVAPVKVTDENGRTGWQRTLVGLPAASMAGFVVGTSVYGGTNVLNRIEESTDDAIRRVRLFYVEATGTFTQVGPDVLGRGINGLRTVTRIFIALAGTALPTQTVGTTAGPSGTILATESTEGSDSAVTRLTNTYMQAGIVQAEKRFDEGMSALLVTFKSFGTRIQPTALNTPTYTLASDILLAFQGGAAAPVIVDRIGNASGYRTFDVTVMLKADGSAMPANGADALVKSYQDFIDYQKPGGIDFSGSQGFIFKPGTSRAVRVNIEEYISTNGVIDPAWGVPFRVKEWAYVVAAYTPEDTGIRVVESKGASGYLGFNQNLGALNAEYAGIQTTGLSNYSAYSNPGITDFYSTDNPVLEIKAIGSFTADNGTVWYRKRKVTLVGTFDAALN